MASKVGDDGALEPTTVDGSAGAPEDGARKTDSSGSSWIACCGVWYSDDAWVPPQQDVERDPAEAARTHRVVPAGTLNCPACGRSLLRHEPEVVDAARVLEVAEAADAPGREAAYAQRLRDTEEGVWLRFGPRTIGPRKSERLEVHLVEPVEDVGFLALPTDVARATRVLDVVVGRERLIDGPIPGEVFAARVPADARRPIDRGGSLRRRITVFPGILTYVVLENVTDEPVEAIGALFAPRVARLSVVADARKIR